MSKLTYNNGSKPKRNSIPNDKALAVFRRNIKEHKAASDDLKAATAAAETTAATAAAETTAATAAKDSISFAERVKGNFAKDKSIWSKGFRVAGVGVGAALTLDAFRAKDKEGNERGFVTRLAEGAAGVGVAAGSLALGGR